MIYLALYKGKGLIGNALIRWWTRSPYSHCELVVDGVAYSSSLMDKGVRAKRIDFKSEHWDMVELPDQPHWDDAKLTGPLRMRVLGHYQATKGQRYSWLDLIRSQIFNGNSDEDGASFCSEWCAAALGLPNPATYSPQTLGDIVRWHFIPRPEQGPR